MNLTFFSAETHPIETGGGISPDAWILFATTGKITLSLEAGTLLGITANDRISLAQDDDQPEIWYLFKDKAGFELKALKSGKLVLEHPELVTVFLDCFGKSHDENHRLFFSVEPVKERRRSYWQMNFNEEQLPEAEETTE